MGTCLVEAPGDCRLDGKVVTWPTVVGGRSVAGHADSDLLARLRARDEASFSDVVERWSGPMLRIARGYVSTDASAQEVVQDAWLAVIRGLSSFQGRSSLKTWVFRILVNQAKTRRVREGRSTPMSSLTWDDARTHSVVEPERFRGPADQYPGGWAPHGWPQRWDTDPEAAAQSAEVRAIIVKSLSALSVQQQTVVVLRDLEGCASDEVCEILGISAAHQRVLLHRGRARVRADLEKYYRKDQP